MSQYVDAVQHIRRAPLMRLTQIPIPGVDDGNPSPCYVNPEYITFFSRACVRIGATTEQQEQRCGTYIAMTTGAHVYVDESPDEVARIREEALGNESTQKGRLRPVEYPA